MKTEARDAALRRAFFASPLPEAESFFVYLSVGTEADTRGLIEELLRRGKRVCVPRIAGEVMLAVPYGELSEGAFGIPAPAKGEDTPCEVALVPLLAFDRKGDRIGYGGGFYDRYLASHPETKRIGYAYAGQETKEIRAEGGDVPLDGLLTEFGLLSFAEESRLS